MRWWRKSCRYLLTLGISVMAVGSVQIVSAAPLDIAGQAAAITAQIQQVKIPERSYDVQSFGAVADGRTDSRNAINQAIAAASKAGGGKVVVPAGHYFVAGPIVLLSNVELHMEDHAEVKFSDRPKDYASPLVLTRFECTEVYNYSPLIYAYGAKNIAITGSGSAAEGMLDGNGAEWWPWVGAKPWWDGGQNQKEDSTTLKDMANNDVPVEQRIFGAGHYLRPIFIEPYASDTILIRGVRLRNSPMYHISPALSKNITIEKVTIEADGPNTDGIDPDSCQNVWIKDNIISAGDDCIAIKSGRDDDGRRLHTPSVNIVVEHNMLKNGHGAITVGSEISGGANHIYSLYNTIDSPELRWPYRFKTNSQRGGEIHDFYADGDKILHLERAVLTVDMKYDGGDVGEYTPKIYSLHLQNLDIDANQRAILTISTYERNPVTDFTLQNCRIQHADKSGGTYNKYENTPPENITVENVIVNGKVYNGNGNF